MSDFGWKLVYGGKTPPPGQVVRPAGTETPADPRRHPDRRSHLVARVQ
jgi:hypothetical protein